MCGRYVLIPGQGFVDRGEWIDQKQADFEATYNAAPSQQLPVVTPDGIELMTWGLVPPWAKVFKPSFTSINARAETLADKPLYSTPFRQRRALILASGYFEWQQRERYKQPYFFQLPDRDVFSFAGLYDIWVDAAGVGHKSFTIITTAPNATMEGVHDRMPVILDRDEEEHWLDYSSEPEQLSLLLDPYKGAMTRHEVDRAVGNVRTNHAGLIAELNSA